MKKYFSYYIPINALIVSLFFFCTSCSDENTHSDIDAKADISKLPSLEMYNSKIYRTDSGRAVMEIDASVIQKFDFASDTAYTLLPKGGKVTQYAKPKSKPIKVTAKWGHIDDREKIYQGKGNVVLVSENDDTIKSEHVYWDTRNKKIYSTVTTTLIRKNKDSLVAKNGFESDDKFKNVKMYQTSGVTRNSNGKIN